MCGILGTIGNFSKHSFETGLMNLQHRGPDGAGIWKAESDPIMLGHRRLAILDISELGKQPMVDAELSITYNGEIFNYMELKQELQNYGHCFYSSSDTEVILKSYRQWGYECLKKFNGMWAFAIWDSDKRRLFLSRDRFGIKPMFYSFTRSGFIFGSEMKAIAPLLDEIKIADHFDWCKNNIYEYENTDKTLVHGIKRFPAGHFAFLQPEDTLIAPVKYWNTLDHVVVTTHSYPKQVEHFREIFFDSCKIRMRSDVKIGTALSGGLDSSSVAAAMHYLGRRGRIKNYDIQGDWQSAFIATFTGTELDEKSYAEEVVKSLNLKAYYNEINPIKGIENLSEYLWLFEELYLTSPIPMIEIYKTIKRNGVSVSLDGHGADELLSGYGTTILNTIKEVPFNYRFIKEIISTYKQLKNIDESEWSIMADGFAGRKNMLNFYVNEIFNKKSNDPLIDQLGYFNASLYKEFHYYILPTLLRNYDRYSMAAGVEVRMPFMDHRLVSYCFSLPWQSKLNNGYTKAILRDAMRPFLSDKIVNRKTKIGFGTPFTKWLKGPWKEYIMDTINSTAFKYSSLVSNDITGKIHKFYANPFPTFEDGHKIWEMIMPFLWEVSFFNRLKST